MINSNIINKSTDNNNKENDLYASDTFMSKWFDKLIGKYAEKNKTNKMEDLLEKHLKDLIPNRGNDGTVDPIKLNPSWPFSEKERRMKFYR